MKKSGGGSKIGKRMNSIALHTKNVNILRKENIALSLIMVYLKSYPQNIIGKMFRKTLF